MSGMKGVEVFICTSPLASQPHSVKEKFEWVHEHMGADWTRRMIVTRDKTMAYGDILIDDRPYIRGVVKRPSWDHVIFTSCHNKHLQPEKLPRVTDRLDNWTNDAWVQLIEKYMKKVT
ncbi:hypothetical protein NP493_35g03018 [Ridgeia piscesae]|uniref:Uncharacterized protein n=1 Tax=Ridgeia piscesae TaxID=27915 RepID=A0AAD9PD18_RIDPI|nr:hypothetical protein NP493_35g03018 [Ridgeia piscesae]